MKQLLLALDIFSEKFLNTLKRFPLVSVALYLFTLITFLQFDLDIYSWEKYTSSAVMDKVSLVLTLAIPLFIAIYLMTVHVASLFVGTLFLVGYYFLLPETLHGNRELYSSRHTFLILSSILFIFVAPFWNKNISNEKFWAWTKQILFALLLTAFLSLIVFFTFLGLMSVLEHLFHIEFNRQFEKELSLFVFVLFGLQYFLSQIPLKPEETEAKPYFRMEVIFTQYILTPIVLLYFLLFSTYLLKTLYFSEWNEGSLSLLVLSFSALSIVTLLFWIGLSSDKTQKIKYWIWGAILIQTMVLLFNLYIRIDAYGLTERRYILLLIAVWLVTLSLYFLCVKKASYKWMFISLSLLLFLSQFGVWSDKNVAKVNQINLLKELLIEDNNLSEESNLSLRYQLSNKIDYLYRHNGIESLMEVLPEIVSAFEMRSNSAVNNCTVDSKENYFPRYASKSLGFTFVDGWQWRNRNNKKKDSRIYISNEIFPNIGLDITAYEWLDYFDVRVQKAQLFCPTTPSREQNQRFTIVNDIKAIGIKKSYTKLADIDMKPFIEEVMKKWKIQRKKDENTDSNENTWLESQDLSYIYEQENLKVKIIFDELQLSKEGKPFRYSGILMIHEK